MKKIFLLLVLTSSISNAQWVQKTSCKKDSEKIVNEAIESMANLEYLTARGMAKSALLLDPNCGCAQLVLAAISSPNPNWGSQKSKLEAIDVSKLSAEEKTWHGYLMASRADRPAFAKSAAAKHPQSPLINYFSTTPADIKTYKTFADNFPEQAASSYNMLSYGYLRGEMGEPNQEMAMEYVKRAQQMYDGPNSYDSMAEHYASLGDYEKALEAELKAIDYAQFASPYAEFAGIYYAKVNQSDFSDQLIKNQKELQDAILKADYEAYAKYEHPDMSHITGDSNLTPFYQFDKTAFEDDHGIDWDSFEFENMDVSYSPNMKTAVITFNATGSYIFKDTKKEVPYSTRGSSVWVNTNQGWKIMHSSWAPSQDGIGIPK